MPNPDLMKDLESDLENALEAKDAQKLMDYINKVRNEQKRYDSDMMKQMSGDDSDENKGKSGSMMRTMEKPSFEKKEPIQMIERMDILIKKAEDGIMDLPSD
tara:strand:- start:2041 stop:2346 length:306 start_codon:yes stop_codon:yes gene_type:complete